MHLISDVRAGPNCASKGTSWTYNMADSESLLSADQTHMGKKGDSDEKEGQSGPVMLSQKIDVDEG